MPTITGPLGAAVASSGEDEISAGEKKKEKKKNVNG